MKRCTAGWRHQRWGNRQVRCSSHPQPQLGSLLTPQHSMFLPWPDLNGKKKPIPIIMTKRSKNHSASSRPGLPWLHSGVRLGGWVFVHRGWSDINWTSHMGQPTTCRTHHKGPIYSWFRGGLRPRSQQLDPWLLKLAFGAQHITPVVGKEGAHACMSS